MSDSAIGKFINDQLSVWPLAAENYRNVKKAETKAFNVGGLDVTLQYNPSRKISSEARLDPESIRKRPCFLCPENRPKEQRDIDFEGRKGRKYRVTLNPYPIFPSHLVVSSAEHTPQSIWHRYQDALDFISRNNSYLCFYNGPKAGASAPDHQHFQACPVGLMPLQVKVDELLDSGDGRLTYLTKLKEAKLYHLEMFTRGVFVLGGATPKSVTKLFYRLLDCAPVPEGEEEPRFNLISWLKDGEYRSVVIFRSKHRPDCYYSTGEDHLSMSPGCADMGGLFVAPQESDFGKMTSDLLGKVVSEVSISEEDEKTIVWRLTRKQRLLEVGVMSGDEIEFEIISDGAGPRKVKYSDGKISYDGALYDELTFGERTSSTMFAEPSFILYGVTIGVGFHWERKLTQKFAGTLRFIVESGKITAVNVIGVEDYLLSVISSEMKSSAGLEFLKAHSVISRSWVLAQIEARKRNAGNAVARNEPSIKDGEYVTWFDHEDHTLYDVCADDHCQRYQGLTMAVGNTVREAIDQTWGLALMSGGEICDARFSKCCGGTMELFSTCWEDKDYPYLREVPDTEGEDPAGDPFCDTSDEAILSQVLNDYDLETKDFFKWKVKYSHESLTGLLDRRSGLGFGDILALVPIERGPSGRIKRLRVIGSERTLVIGKELIIRKFLSESHLKSSAFDVRYIGEGGEEIPASLVESAAEKGRLVWKEIVLDGTGWGHGVGLCQIGAAVMAAKGHGFEEILSHYYPGATLSR